MDWNLASISWIAVALCGIALSILAGKVLIASLQNRIHTRQWLRQSAMLHQMQETELAITLHQTYADLSLRDREPEWFDVRVVKILQESSDTRSFYFVNRSGELLPSFLAGQHILVERPASDTIASDCRCYSLSDECHAGYWRITVKRANGHPNSVSRWLHEEVHVGDRLRVRGPSGSFYLQSCTARNVVLLSAGVGITPMIPMLLQAVNRPHGSLHFMTQFRDIDHAPFAEQLLSFSDAHPSVRLKLWLSRFPRGVRGSDTSSIQEGKFTASDVCSEIDAISETDVYLCGPESWIANLKQGLLEEGVLESNIHYELFHSSASPAAALPPADRKEFVPCSVHFRQSNRLAEFAAAFPNLLGFAIQSQIPIDSGCRTGACGSCAVKLLQGKVRYTRKPQYQLKPNEILPCVCVPDGDIVVDA